MTETDKTERERFEAWVRTDRPLASLERDADGDYVKFPVEMGWQSWKARAALDTGTDGWLYYNPDTGPEWSEQHPIESGEVPGALEVREATVASIKAELLAAWDAAAPQLPASASAGKVAPVTCIACEGPPQAPNDPCAVCGKSGDTQPVAVAWMADAGKRSTWTLHKSKHDAFLASEACGGSIRPLYTAPPSHPYARQAAEEMRESAIVAIKALHDPKDDGWEKAIEAVESVIHALPLPGDKEG